MPDVKDVIKGLEEMLEDSKYNDSVQYNPWADTETLEDALALLKAQEPETSDAPKSDNNVGCWYDITHNYTLEQVVSALKAQEPITGETSDGYHTFNELYHHRAVLFSVIVANYPDMAWKSKKHHDGTMYDGMFIVGIETPDGQATYHYDIDPYWDMFKCRVLDNAPEWDGHTPAQAIERIGKLKAQEPSDDWISRKRLKNEIQYYIEEAGWGEEINKALGWCLEFIDNQEAVKWE